MKRYYLPVLFIIVAVSFVVYLPLLDNGFVNWDDDGYILNNPLIRSINLKEIFSSYQMGNYHPLTILTYAIEYHFFGLSAKGFHAISLLFHLLSVVLVFYAVFLLSNKPEVALIASLLFGVHPLHVESIAWASELKDLLYTFFFLASYTCYLLYLKKGQRKFYWYCLLLFLLSLLSKAMAASLPAVMLLTDYFMKVRSEESNDLPSKRWGKLLLEKVPFIILSIVFGVLAVIAQKSWGGILDTANVFPLFQRIVFACYGFITYLIKLLIPLHLSAYYPYPVKNGAAVPAQYYVYILFFFVLIALTFYSLRHSRKIIFGIGFFASTVFLVLQLFPVGSAVMADRYSYLPSVGMFYLAGEGLYLLWNKKSIPVKIIAPILLSASVLFFSITTYGRCGVWKNGMTLWNDVIGQYQTIPVAYNNRGNLLKDEKKYDEALGDYNKTIELQSDFYHAYNNRGALMMIKERHEEALLDFNKAIALKHDYEDAYNNRGILFAKEKRVDQAISDFNAAIRLNPDNYKTYNYRGQLFSDENRIDEALDDFAKSIKLDPYYPEAYYNRGILFEKGKKYDEALNDYSKAIALQADNSEAYSARGLLLAKQSRVDEAIRDFNKAIELKPNASTYNNRGIALKIAKRNEDALHDYNKSIALDSAFHEAYNNRGSLFLEEKKYEDALRDFNKAIDLNPKYAEAYDNRGNLMELGKRYDEAIRNYDKVIEMKPRDSNGYYNRGNLLITLRKFSEALNDYNKVIELEPTFAEAYYNRAIIENGLGKKEMSCLDLQKAIKMGYEQAALAYRNLCHR